MSTERKLSKAEGTGLLAVESEHKGIKYAFDPKYREVYITAPRGELRLEIILPLAVIGEIAEAAEVLI